MKADALIREALQGREVTAHACQRCKGVLWILTVSGECVCQGCGTVPVTIAVVPVIAPTSLVKVS
jgi:uncharacterized Zn finger protein (UPF0148 family)